MMEGLYRCMMGGRLIGMLLESSFDQAVEISPDECYVLALYARFLWDMEDNEDMKEDSFCKDSPLSFFNGVHPPLTPLAAAY